MKKWYRILFLTFFIFINCKTYKESIKENSFVKTSLNYKSGELKAKGFYNKEYYDDVKLPVGLWTEYYKNGVIKSIGEYKMENYTDCCTGGICKTPYSYKIGEWKYFFNDRKLKEKGIYRIGTKIIETSCEGGAEIKYGRVNKNWIFYNVKGELREISKKEIQNIEKESVVSYWDAVKLEL